ncbi:type II toxin-antitoxin system VapC family toxin [Halorarum halophilum]|uniref:Type II toxin-antitoxin system VapC family toxin n=1 Tax=Halorarum halophilum TaxID=2743090 RepID=A0A7D5KXX7_9EURY|nr:PIN domain-containing protein [Halobaculum halophilum]QLG28918.1 type II toxin-antitoxin system VapC family toxin [Halobaculum halophilum]
MSVFIDTGVFYAHHDKDASRHDEAHAFFEAMLDGEFGQPFTNDYVFDEVVTLTQRRTRDFDAARTIADRIRGVDPFPDVVSLEFIDQPVFESALEVFETYADHSLSFTDAVSVSHCEQASIDQIASFDDDFDGVFERLDPTAVSG